MNANVDPTQANPPLPSPLNELVLDPQAPSGLAKLLKAIGLVLFLPGLAALICLLLTFVSFGPIPEARERLDVFIASGPHEAVLDASVQLLTAATEPAVCRNPAELDSIPRVLRDLQPRSISVNPETGVRIELCGGWDHFGLWVKREEGEWRLSWYTEGRRGLLLEKRVPDASQSASSIRQALWTPVRRSVPSKQAERSALQASPAYIQCRYETPAIRVG